MMKNMKKIISLVVVFNVLLTALVPAFATESFTYESKASQLHQLGLYNAVSENEFTPDLGSALDRQTGVVMLLRMFGMEADALAMSDLEANQALTSFNDSALISSWAKKSIAYAVKKGLVNGLPNGTFAPQLALQGREYCSLILKQLGYTPDYKIAAGQLAERGGLTASQAIDFNNRSLIRDDLVGISFGSLAAQFSNGDRIIDRLIQAGIADKKIAESIGLGAPPKIIPVVDKKHSLNDNDNDNDEELVAVDTIINKVEAMTTNTLKITMNSPYMLNSIDISKVKVVETDIAEPENIDQVASLPVCSVTIAPDKMSATLTLSVNIGEDVYFDVDSDKSESNLAICFKAEAFVLTDHSKSLELSFNNNLPIEDKIVPSFSKVYAKADSGEGHNIIVVDFNEDVITSEGNAESDFKVVDITSADSILIPDIDYTVAAENGDIEITIIQTGIVDHRFSVELLPNAGYICDYAENHPAFGATNILKADKLTEGGTISS